MISAHGISIFNAVAFGSLYIYNRPMPSVFCNTGICENSELSKFSDAKISAAAQLDSIRSKALLEVGKENADIFDIHKMILDDFDFNNAVCSIIKSQKVNADFAVAVASEVFSDLLASSDDLYMHGRAADVRDVSGRLIRILLGCKYEEPAPDLPDLNKIILFSDDLLPSETVKLDKNIVQAFVTSGGSPDSHSSILAKTMKIPAIVSTGFSPDPSLDGAFAAVDGFSGTLYICPDKQTVDSLSAKISDSF
ncbi:MAG: PEP-utilizing enzyme [Ruminococcus sp.]|jgi:phosphotransferase system enzyme I (PtsI)|nr:PEP-utilizing enzyme [Ruminococcus sp.]